MDSLVREPAKPPKEPEKPLETANARGWQRYIRKRPRSLIPPIKTIGGNRLSKRSIGWVLPWSIADYPGKQVGAIELLGGKVCLETIRQWNRGNDPLPGWAALVIADAIRSRAKAGLALVAELEAYAEANPRKKPAPGFRAVDPVTGQDKRGGKVGRKRKVKEV